MEYRINYYNSSSLIKKKNEGNSENSISVLLIFQYATLGSMVTERLHNSMNNGLNLAHAWTIENGKKFPDPPTLRYYYHLDMTVTQVAKNKIKYT